MGGGYLVYDEESGKFQRRSRSDVWKSEPESIGAGKDSSGLPEPRPRKSGSKRRLIAAVVITILAFAWLLTSLLMMLYVKNTTEKRTSANVEAGSGEQLGNFVDEIETESPLSR
ncbi:MAG: hypothetical protein KJ626_11255 [Verrucomicrobia bacterium]|nr:hypothetical protein [Verrucomicrobiota bacterium]